MKRDDKEDEEPREEKRQKKEDTDGGRIEDLEEMIGRDRGQASKKTKTKDERPDEGMTITISDTPGTKRDLESAEVGESSPNSPKKLYAPAFAGNIQRIQYGDDEEFNPWDCFDEGAEIKNEGWEGDDEGHPPEVTAEELEALDEKAEEEEMARLLKMPVLKPLEEEEEKEYNVISSKLATVWKHRQEKHGWFRRARLVARQFKNSVDFEEFSTFAPTSASIIPRLFAHMMLNVHVTRLITMVDVKDAFMMAEQPSDEKNAIRFKDKLFGLIRCLPGQRTAAKCWYDVFKGVVTRYGGTTNPLQPTLFKLKDLFISVHVDDLMMLGSPTATKNFLEQWKLDIEGPLQSDWGRVHVLEEEVLHLP